MIIVRSEPTPTLVMEVVTDPADLAAARVREECYDRNWAWFQAHSLEIYREHRGKVVCIAGESLFVGEKVLEVVARAKAAYSEDVGLFTMYIPHKRRAGIYVNQW